jgi:hypothetical protein
MKSAALKNSAMAVVKSAPVPTRRPREYIEFDEFVDKADTILRTVNRIRKVCEGLTGGNEPAPTKANMELDMELAEAYLREWTTKAPAALTEFKQLMDWYNRKELYEPETKGGRLSKRVVSESMGLLLASVPNSNVGSPEVFAQMMIEEVYAAEPSACTLESACRHIRRTIKKFGPSIADVLAALEEQNERWSDRWLIIREDGDTVDSVVAYWQGELTEAIAEGHRRIEALERRCK